MRNELNGLKHNLRSTSSTVTALKKEVGDLRSKAADYKKKLIEHEKKFSDQNKVITELNRKISDQDKVIGDLNRKVLEYDQKFVDVLAEITRSRGTSDYTTDMSNKEGSHTNECDQKRDSTEVNEAKVLSSYSGKGKTSQKGTRFKRKAADEDSTQSVKKCKS